MRRTLSRLVAMSALLAAPAMARGQASARDTTAAAHRPPFAALSRSALALRDSIVALARAQIGTRYVYGGASPDRGFDCSGLVKYIVSALHISLPRTARAQARAGRAVPADTSRLLPGDLLTFGRGGRISHVGIYVGDGRFVHASSMAGRVVESRLLRPAAPGIKPWRGARRLVLADSIGLVTAPWGNATR